MNIHPFCQDAVQYFAAAVVTPPSSPIAELALAKTVKQHSNDFGLTTLIDNYPNPFSISTTIDFTLEHSGYAQLIIQDYSGKVLAVLKEGQLAGGAHTVEYNSSQDLPAGLYFYSLITEKGTYSKKMINTGGSLPW